MRETNATIPVMVSVVMLAITLTSSSDTVSVTLKDSSASNASSSVMVTARHFVSPSLAPEEKVRTMDVSSKSDPAVAWSKDHNLRYII